MCRGQDRPHEADSLCGAARARVARRPQAWPRRGSRPGPGTPPTTTRPGWRRKALRPLRRRRRSAISDQRSAISDQRGDLSGSFRQEKRRRALPPGCLLVRTWFGDDDVWRRLVKAVTTETDEGFVGSVEPPARVRSRHPRSVGAVRRPGERNRVRPDPAPTRKMPLRA
jgi:hypothetical protein